MSFVFHRWIIAAIVYSLLFSILIVIVQEVAKSSPDLYRCIISPNNYSPWIIDATRGNVAWVNTTTTPSPDGTSALRTSFYRGQISDRLELITPLGEYPIQENVWDSTWSPDGQYIVYKWLSPENIFRLGLADAEGNVISDVEIVTATDDYDSFWSYGFSGDMRYIAYSFRTVNEAEIQFRSVPDLQLVRSISVSSLPLEAFWSSQGHVLGVDIDGHSVRLISPETGQIVLHDFAAYGGANISWSPDGRFLTYQTSSRESDGIDIFRVTTLGMLDIDGVDHLNVAEISLPDRSGVGGTPEMLWSDDNRSLIIWRSSSVEGYELVRYDLEDGHYETLVDGWAKPGVYSPDRRYSTFYRFLDDETIAIELVDIQENSHRVVGEYPLSRGFEERFWSIFWSPDSSGVVMGSGIGGYMGTIWFDVVDNYPMQVASGEFPVGAQWSINQHTIFYTPSVVYQVRYSLNVLDLHTGVRQVIQNDFSQATITRSFIVPPQPQPNNSDILVYWEMANGQAGYNYYSPDGQLVFDYSLSVHASNPMNARSPSAYRSPDGRYVVFTGGVGGTNIEHYSTETDTGFSLLDTTLHPQIAWSPDSELFSILISGQQQFQSTHYIFRADGTEITHYELSSPYSLSSQEWTTCG